MPSTSSGRKQNLSWTAQTTFHNPWLNWVLLLLGPGIYFLSASHSIIPQVSQVMALGFLFSWLLCFRNSAQAFKLFNCSWSLHSWGRTDGSQPTSEPFIPNLTDLDLGWCLSKNWHYLTASFEMNCQFLLSKSMWLIWNTGNLGDTFLTEKKPRMELACNLNYCSMMKHLFRSN